MMTLKEIEHGVSAHRSASFEEARNLAPFVHSRGTHLCTADMNGGQCSPLPEAEAAPWHGSMREITEVIEQVKDNPNVGEVYIAGGFDGADSVADYKAGEYEPWVSSWKLTVWSRPVLCGHCGETHGHERDCSFDNHCE